MRHQGWMLLFAGLIAAPQWSLGAEVWRTPAAYPEGIASHGAGMPALSRYPSHAMPAERPAIPRYAETARSMREQGFRFRPWDGTNASQLPQRPVYPRPADSSHWGGARVNGGPAYVPAVPAENPQQFQPWSTAGWRPSGTPVGRMPRRTADQPWSAQGYRFRPLAPARQSQLDRQIRYRSLQVQIPDRYVFRPLNPVARTATPPTPRQPAWSYPPVAYSMGYNGYTPYASMPPGSWNPDVYAAPAYAALPWGGMPPAYGRPLRMPQQHYPPPAYAQGMNPMPRFRPDRPLGRDHYGQRGHGQRYARQHPAWRRPMTPQAPYWAYQRRIPLYAYNGYGWDRRTEQRQTIPPARLNRYGTDWYDGRADSEGAWYRLAVEAAPAISQSWEGDSGLIRDRY